jgi:hypothetical protein
MVEGGGRRVIRSEIAGVIAKIKRPILRRYSRNRLRE